jgi:DNA-binding transcriptional regulator YiaG
MTETQLLNKRVSVARSNAARRKERFNSDPEFRDRILANSNKKPANAIRRFRLTIGFNQNQMAARLKCANSTIRNWENDRSFPDKPFRDELDRLAVEKKVEPINWREAAEEGDAVEWWT